MEKDFSCISEIREIRRMKSVLSERETRLSRPMLCDYAMIPTLYSWFNDIMEGDEGGQPGKAYARMKFIFIILFRLRRFLPGAHLNYFLEFDCDFFRVLFQFLFFPELGLDCRQIRIRNLRIRIQFHFRTFLFEKIDQSLEPYVELLCKFAKSYFTHIS